MGLVINTNVSSLITQRNLINKIHKVHSSYEKLASGYRINHSSDDASGLSISDTIRTQIYGNQKAADCTQDGINTLQIAEGALSVISENLQRIRELTVQAASDNNSTAERKNPPFLGARWKCDSSERNYPFFAAGIAYPLKNSDLLKGIPISFGLWFVLKLLFLIGLRVRTDLPCPPGRKPDPRQGVIQRVTCAQPGCAESAVCRPVILQGTPA